MTYPRRRRLRRSQPRNIFKIAAKSSGFLGGLAAILIIHSAHAIDLLRLHHHAYGGVPTYFEKRSNLPVVSTANRSSEGFFDLFEFGPIWLPVGPSPIPNGQTFGTNNVPVSGRVSAIAVDPTNPNIIYVGGAQGGVFRSLDGGRSWLTLFAGAKNFAIGSITVDPRDHDRLLIGTGEGNLSGDSHFGIGIYVVENATSFFARVSGPYNLDTSGNDVFSNRSIVKILVDPQDTNIIFVATSSGVGGLGAQRGATLPPRGLYRSLNFRSGNPTFQRLAVGPGLDTIVTGAALDPNDSNHLICSAYGQVAGPVANANPQGGLYVTSNALAVTPLFTRSRVTDQADGNLPLFTNVKLATAHDPSTNQLIVLAATSEYPNTTIIDPATGLPFQYLDQGEVRKSVDGGVTFDSTLPSANGFAGGQGFYNIAIAIDQINPSNIYLAGTVSSAGVDPDGGPKPIIIDGQPVLIPGPKDPVTDPVNGTGPANGGGTFQYSTDGGATFIPSVNKLHADSHAIAIAPSAPNVVYTGNDGGVWRSSDRALSWTDINDFGFLATQFESVAVHPTDRNYTIGGTQDNGTILRRPNGSLTRADFGDGGYALIDQSATDTEHVTLYHTYFNESGSLIGFGRVLSTTCATEGEWSFLGIYGGTVDPTVHCDGTTDTFNGIKITDNVNFYAPMALGPGTPNTVYFGSDRLYRSTNQGTTMQAVSQSPLIPLAAGSNQGVPVSSIAISPLNDQIRVVGLNNGNVFATAVGSPALVNITGTLPAKYVTRIALSSVNPDVAYVAFNGYGLATGQQVYKTTNLVSALKANALPVWTPAGNGIPDVSVNGLVIDPIYPDHLFAGTDFGVYATTNGGQSWSRYGIGFPRVEVYDLKVQGKYRVLRAATHGLGFWEAYLGGRD